MRTSKILGLAKGALLKGYLELGSVASMRSMSSSTDLKAVLQEKIPAEQVSPDCLRCEVTSKQAEAACEVNLNPDVLNPFPTRLRAGAPEVSQKGVRQR